MRGTAPGTFVYANPRTVHWGAGTLADNLEASLRQTRGTRVFVITTRSVAAHAALGGRLRELLGTRLVWGVRTDRPARASGGCRRRRRRRSRSAR